MAGNPPDTPGTAVAEGGASAPRSQHSDAARPAEPAGRDWLAESGEAEESSSEERVGGGASAAKSVDIEVASIPAAVGKVGGLALDAVAKPLRPQRSNRVESLSIENFKAIAGATIPLGDVTILVRPNGQRIAELAGIPADAVKLDLSIQS